MAGFDTPEQGPEGAGRLARLCASLRTARPERMLVLGVALQLGSLIVMGMAAAEISQVRFTHRTATGQFFSTGSVVGMFASALQIVGWGLVIFAAARLVADSMKAR